MKNKTLTPQVIVWFSAWVLGSLLLFSCGKHQSGDADLPIKIANRLAGEEDLLGSYHHPRFHLQIYKGDTLIYSTQPEVGRLAFEENTQYKLVIGSTSDPIIKLKIETLGYQKIWEQDLKVGDNTFVAPAVGTYFFDFVGSTPDKSLTEKKRIMAEVSCRSQMRAYRLNPSQVQVKALSGNNYQFFAQWAIIGFSLSELECNWDFNGDGIFDGPSVNCNQGAIAYSNHVGLRKI